MSCYLGLASCTEDEWHRTLRPIEESFFKLEMICFSANPVPLTSDYIYFISGHDRMTDSALYLASYYIDYLEKQGERPALLYGDETSKMKGGRVNAGNAKTGNVKTGNAKGGRGGRPQAETYYKPDFAPEYLAEENYIGRNFIVRRDCLEELGFDYRDYSDEWAYQLLDAIAQTYGQKGIFHIPVVLSETEMTLPAARPGKTLDVLSSDITVGTALTEEPLVSILIPTSDHIDDLDRCLKSIRESMSYKNVEILLLDNNSKDPATEEYYQTLDDENVQVIHLNTPWNYSRINNLGATYARGEFLLFLNNDTMVQTGDFVEQMLRFGLNPEIGAVGAKLFYPDATIQHAGVTLGIRGAAGHAFLGRPGTENGYMNRLMLPQNVSAVTGACMLVRRAYFDEVGGFTEELSVAFNDTDLCLKLRKKGYRNVFTPYAKLTHFESKSRGIDEDSPEKLARFNQECQLFQKRWIHDLIQGDPYYNPHLRLDVDDFSEAETYQLF